MANRDKVHNLLNDAIVEYNMNNLEINSCNQMIRRTENQNRKLAKAYYAKSKSRMWALLGTALSLVATGVFTIGAGISFWTVALAGVMCFQTINLLKVHNEVKSLRREFAQNNSMIRMYDRTKWFLEGYGQFLENKRETLRYLYEQKQLTDEQISQKLAEIGLAEKQAEELKELFVDDYEGTKQAIVMAEKQDEQQQEI